MQQWLCVPQRDAGKVQSAAGMLGWLCSHASQGASYTGGTASCSCAEGHCSCGSCTHCQLLIMDVLVDSVQGNTWQQPAPKL
jgi:hypothetical protein